MAWQKQIQGLFSFGMLSIVLAGCSTMPKYQSMDQVAGNFSQSDVIYQIDPTVGYQGIDCLAIMPLDVAAGASETIEFVTFDNPETPSPYSDTVPVHEIYPVQLNASDKQKMLRNLLFAYVAPHKTRDIEIADIDKWLTPGESNHDYQNLAGKLGCNWFLEGEITQFSVNYYGVYSNVIAAADLKIIHAPDNKTAWHGRHVARSQDGGLPLSLLDVTVGAVRAAANINQEQLERTVSDLARRLARTMPLEEDNSFLSAAKRKQLLQVIASSLNLRSGPGQAYSVSRILKHREAVTLLDGNRSSSWLRVQTQDGHTGYVASRYLN